MADPLERWVAFGSCRMPTLHHFIPQDRVDSVHRRFRCAICRLEATKAMVTAYRLGVEAMGGNGHAVAPSLTMPTPTPRELPKRGHWQERQRERTR